MNNTLSLNVTQETVNYIQRLQYEKTMKENIISRILTTNNSENIIDSALFKKYEDSLAEITAEYEMAKGQLEKDYVPDALKGHQYSWNLDFQTNEFVITISCDCGIKILEEINNVQKEEA